MFSLTDRKPALRTWAVAATFGKLDGSTSLSIRIVQANSFEEAVGLMYFHCRDKGMFVSMNSVVCQEITEADLQPSAPGVLT